MSHLPESRSSRPPHLSDDNLVRMMDQELSSARRLFAKGHLTRCAGCQARFDSLERTAHRVIVLRQSVVDRLSPLSSTTRHEFLRQVDIQLESTPARSWWNRFPDSLQGLRVGNVASSWASSMAIIFAVFFLLLVWRSQIHSVSAAEFLNRAVSADQTPARVTHSGLIRRRFRVTTPGKTIEHDVYRDVSGRSQPQSSEQNSDDADLPARLALAGVNWDDPLSAVSFRNWHDRQSHPKDEVHPTGDGLLTVSTKLATSEIAQESLTVREGDFHPVERTIQYREFGAVEISEVSVDLLTGTSAVRPFVDRKPFHAVPALLVPSLPPLPTATQMDETELEALLILDQQNADMGEQVEVTRNVQGVNVLGLVESEERKEELMDSLNSLPFLSVRIESYDDLRSADGPVNTQSTEEQSAIAEVSPLERYFMQQGRSREDLSRISAALFNTSLAIGESTRSIEQIVIRFPSDENLTPVAIQSRQELLSRTISRLQDDLNKQQQLLEDARISFDLVAPTLESPDACGIDLVGIAERNAAATKELISGASEHADTETKIAAKLTETISELRDAGLAFNPRP